MSYKWNFANVGGATRVCITSGEDIRHLGELDQKMWTVLACPTKGLEIDEKSLLRIDTDNDGKIRVNEVVATAEWLCNTISDPQLLIAGKDSIALADIKDEAILAVAKQIVGDKDSVSVADVEAAIAAVTINETPAPEAPLAADVMAAYNEKKAEYADYFQRAKLEKLGLAVTDPETAPKMQETDFVEMGEKIAAYEAGVAAAAAANADALAAATAQYQPLYKLLLVFRDFYKLLKNFVTFQDFYSRDPENLAIFQAGTLMIDQRALELCVKVDDMGKQTAQAPASSMYILFCTCSHKTLAQTFQIAAVVTDGDVNNLMVGKNAIFYDRNGQDWDAVVTAIIDNPISIRQAFWSPYKKLAKWVEDLINKRAAEKDAKSFDNMTAKMQSAEAPADGAAPKPAFDIAKFAGIFAAIGMALGMIGTALMAVFSGLADLKWWQLLLVFVAIMLVISGPAMLLAWMKLRRRNLAPVLNANGWAINANSIVNIDFGATLTDLAKYPVVKMKDPFAKNGMATWKKWLIAIACLIVVLVGLWLGNIFGKCGMKSPLPRFNQEEVVEAEPVEENAEAEVAEVAAEDVAPEAETEVAE